MNKERREDIATQLESKANSILDGELGPKDHGGDDERWAVDLRSAAKKIRAGEFDDLTESELTEVEYGCDIDVAELEAMRDGTMPTETEPDLLYALKRAFAVISQHHPEDKDCCSRDIETIKAAIAKAEGRTA